MRILDIDRYNKSENNLQEILDGGVNIKTGAVIDKESLDAEMAIEFDEHFAFQECQAWAHASNVITTGVAQVIYNALGEVMNDKNGGWQDHVTLARKVTITRLMGELLSIKVSAASSASKFSKV